VVAISVVLLAVPTDGRPGPIPPMIPWGFVSFFALVSVLHDRRLSALARTRPLVSLGVFSYSLYLIHEPIVHVAYALLSQRHFTAGQQLAVYEGALLPLCIGLGYVFYRLVERPLVRRSHLVFKRSASPAQARSSPLEPG